MPHGRCLGDLSILADHCGKVTSRLISRLSGLRLTFLRDLLLGLLVTAGGQRQGQCSLTSGNARLILQRRHRNGTVRLGSRQSRCVHLLLVLLKSTYGLLIGR